MLTNEKVESSDNDQMRDEDERKVSNGATDEELTPLTWLHDKNLLKGDKTFFYFLCYISHLWMKSDSFWHHVTWKYWPLLYIFWTNYDDSNGV